MSVLDIVTKALNVHNARRDAHANINALGKYTNVVVVDAGGNGDYTTQAAAAAAITDDDASHIYNVFVFGEAINQSAWVGRQYIKVHGADCLQYVATLSQSGSNAPVPTVLKNTLGVAMPAWSRAAIVGVLYYIDFSELSFPASATLVKINDMDFGLTGSGGPITITNASSSGIQFSMSADPNIANFASVEISIYSF